MALIVPLFYLQVARGTKGEDLLYS